MGFLGKIFGSKDRRAGEEQSGWDQIVYDRRDVDFSDEEQRRRYITNCLEQMAEATKEINQLNGEYDLVTAYLTDMEEIEALPEEPREELNRVANQLIVMEREREKYYSKKDRMPDSEYYRMRKQENEMEEGIAKLQEAEKYGRLVKQDLQKLDGERSAYEFRRAELAAMQANLRGMAVIFISALAACIIMLVILQFVFQMNTYVGYFLAVIAAAVAITAVFVKNMDAEREMAVVERAVSKLVQVQNKVKIRYVNNTNLLEYLYMKYDTDSAAKLQKLWEVYQEEKEERKQYQEAEAKMEYYQKELVKQLSQYRISDPERWINQPRALLDQREMVEIRHSLILRRQALRKQLEYNKGIAEEAHHEIVDVVKAYPHYGQEIMAMVDRYGG